MKKKVTIIITTYSRPNTLDRAIKSCLNQTYSNLEIIVVDDNGDGARFRKETESVMKKYKNEKNIKYIKHKKNLNGANARNTGIKNSVGDYILFLDDDDELINNKIEMGVSILESKPQFSMVYSGYIIKRGNRIVKEIIPKQEGDLKAELLLMDWGTGSGSNILFSREVFLKSGLFDGNLRRHQDWDMVLRAFIDGFKITYDNNINLIINKDSRINIPEPTIFDSNKKYYLDKYSNVINKLDIKIKNRIYKKHLIELSAIYFRSGRIKSGIKIMKQAKEYEKLYIYETIYLICNSLYKYIPLKNKIVNVYGKYFEYFRIVKS